MIVSVIKIRFLYIFNYVIDVDNYAPFYDSKSLSGSPLFFFVSSTRLNIFIFLFDKVSHFNKKVIFVGIKVID